MHYLDDLRGLPCCHHATREFILDGAEHYDDVQLAEMKEL